MLYERWRKIAGERRNELALRDPASGRRWTFAELFAAGESWKGAPVLAAPRLPSEGWSDPARLSDIIFPQGHSPEFILDLLAAWRENKMVCPLEPGQGGASVLASRLVSSLAPPIVHFKFTSATAGAARLVALTAEQLMADADNIVATMGLRAGLAEPRRHFHGALVRLFQSGAAAAAARHSTDCSRPRRCRKSSARTAENEPAITLAAVPAMWRAWHEADAIPSSVRLAISAGAPLSVDLEQAIFKSPRTQNPQFLRRVRMRRHCL